MPGLRLRIGGTGTVIASIQHSVVAILSQGRIDIPTNASWLNLVRLVSDALDRGEPFEKRVVRAERLPQIVAAMHRHGHGGAVVVTPPDGAPPAGMDVKYVLDADGAKIVQERVAMFESAARESQLLEDAWLHGQPSETPQPQWSLKTETKKVTRRLLDTALRHVGHLSSVDGAVFHHHQCMCFVASQDGRLSLFAWLEKDESVIVIRGLEHCGRIYAKSSRCCSKTATLVSRVSSSAHRRSTWHSGGHRPRAEAARGRSAACKTWVRRSTSTWVTPWAVARYHVMASGWSASPVPSASSPGVRAGRESRPDRASGRRRRSAILR